MSSIISPLIANELRPWTILGGPVSVGQILARVFGWGLANHERDEKRGKVSVRANGSFRFSKQSLVLLFFVAFFFFFFAGASCEATYTHGTGGYCLQEIRGSRPGGLFLLPRCLSGQSQVSLIDVAISRIHGCMSLILLHTTTWVKTTKVSILPSPDALGTKGRSTG